MKKWEYEWVHAENPEDFVKILNGFTSLGWRVVNSFRHPGQTCPAYEALIEWEIPEPPLTLDDTLVVVDGPGQQPHLPTIQGTSCRPNPRRADEEESDDREADAEIRARYESQPKPPTTMAKKRREPDFPLLDPEP